MKLLSLSLLLFFGLQSCQLEDSSPQGRYRTAVTEGLQSDTGPTETVLGIDLGIPAQAYYERCTELNRRQLITMGQGGNVVDYQLPDQLKRPAIMSFGPVFSKDGSRTVESVTINFIYQDWSPWNRDAAAENLLPDAAAYLSRTLPVEFIELAHPARGRTFVSVDGRRLLALWKRDASTVTGTFTDLSTQSGDPLKLFH